MSMLLSRDTKPDITVYRVRCIVVMVLQLLGIVCIPRFDDYGFMSFVSLAQLAIFVAAALVSPGRQPFVILFLVANWIFNCGQIVCIAMGYGTDDVLNLDFRWYGSPMTIENAFRFYLYSQTLVCAGALLLQKKPINKSEIGVSGRGVDPKLLAKCFILVGLPFWVYLNGAKLMGAASDAYRGVYSLIIPAPVQAISFFFEAGLLLMLLVIGRERKGTTLFWIVVAINVLIMTTGSRQYSVCFLAVWCLVYFCYVNKLSVGKALVLILVCVCLMFLIDAFGELRSIGFSFEALSAYLAKASFFDVVWESLGEFGSAFSTLVISMSRVPSVLPYGMGATYVAGFLSVVPMLVGRFPLLKEATQFTVAISGSAFLGGSMLGEFFYNFGWFGVVGSFLVGALLAWCQSYLNEGEDKRHIVRAWASAVLAVYLLLFIRGYFTDATMKLVYVFLFYCLASWLIDYKLHRRFPKCGRVTDKVDAV